jgi:nitroreductase
MHFADLIKTRYSVRAYRPDPVEDDKLAQVLEAVRIAPSASNRQPFAIVILHTQGREDELKSIYNKDWFVQPPLVLCICGIPGEAWTRRSDRKSMCDVDAAIAMDHLTLAATDLGLGTCWIAAFEMDAARKVLGVPDDVEPLLFTPLGYPLDSVRPKQRKSIENLVHYERW